MHSSRMRTASSLTIGGGSLPRGMLAQGSVCQGGVPCDLSHNVLDVTCMLSQYQLRVNTYAAAYIVLVGHMTVMHARIPPPLP